MEEMNIEADAEQALHRIAEAAEKLLPLLSEDEQRQVRGSVELLERKVIPLLNHECPLLVAVTGGGSVGKSTLFNMLAGGKFSGVKSRAGYTRRTLAAIHPSVAGSEDRMALLFELFRKNALPVRLKSPDEMLEPGDPLYVESENMAEQIAVLDTPDFDTGSADAFANRDAAEEILAASDVLIYLFTNQTYSNKANTDFVRRSVSGAGRKKIVLVYRCSAAYPDEEVGEHMDEVLRNLFPDSESPRSEALGLYRVDESDAVVKGEADPTVRPFSGGPDIVSLIKGLDIVKLRQHILRSQCKSVVDEMEGVVRTASERRCELVAYRDVIRIMANYAVLKGLEHFPQRSLMEQFVECWRRSQPGLVRFAHWTGRCLSSGVKWLGKKLKRDAADAGPTSAEEYEGVFRRDFRDCVGKLRAKLGQPVLGVEVSSKAESADLCKAVEMLASRREKEYAFCRIGKDKAECSVSRPTTLARKLDDVIKDIIAPGNDEWIEEAVKIACQRNDMATEIAVLVDEARGKMSVWERSRELLWAVAATLPPIAAVTWIVCTSDPVVGTGVIAQLGAMFGLGDLYAVIAIPASLGLDAANKKCLEERLKGLYEKWFGKKRGPISGLIDEKITSRCIRPCDDLLKATEAPLARLQEAISMVGAGKECVA